MTSVSMRRDPSAALYRWSIATKISVSAADQISPLRCSVPEELLRMKSAMVLRLSVLRRQSAPAGYAQRSPGGFVQQRASQSAMQKGSRPLATAAAYLAENAQ